MPGKTLDIEDLLEINDDPRFITGIFNYCDRRCEKCAFTMKCRLYADEQRDQQDHPGDDWSARVQRSLERTIEMLKRWCKREGIDFDTLSQAETSTEVKAEMERVQEARRDPLVKLAEQYTFASLKLAQALRTARALAEWPAEATDALDTIEWFALRVASKIHRAITGYAERDEDESGDPVQSDWNGSAKVARLDIAESRAAWETILRVGMAAEDSPLRQVIGLLDDIEAGIAMRFPQAMAFVRPGFDDGSGAESVDERAQETRANS